jgi:hypothetical protein
LIARTIRNTQIHCVGRMQSFGMLKWVVHIVTTGLYRVQAQPVIEAKITYELNKYNYVNEQIYNLTILICAFNNFVRTHMVE